MQVKNFEELAASNALVRPGAMKSICRLPNRKKQEQR